MFFNVVRRAPNVVFIIQLGLSCCNPHQEFMLYTCTSTWWTIERGVGAAWQRSAVYTRSSGLGQQLLHCNVDLLWMRLHVGHIYTLVQTYPTHALRRTASLADYTVEPVGMVSHAAWLLCPARATYIYTYQATTPAYHNWFSCIPNNFYVYSD